jgi:hypothetical protein
MKSQPLPGFDKLYWLRIGLAAVAGFTAQMFVPTDYTTGLTIGIAVYLASYYVARFTWYKGLDNKSQGKVYTTGIGGFVMVFLFTWILLYTLQVAGYSV